VFSQGHIEPFVGLTTVTYACWKVGAKTDRMGWVMVNPDLTIRWAFSYFTHSRGSRVLLAGGTMRLPITSAENGCRKD